MTQKLSLFAIILCLLFSMVSVSPASAGGLDYDKSQIKPTEMQAKDTGSFWDFLPFDFGDGLKDTLKKIEKFFKPVIKALGDAIDWAANGIKGIGDWWNSLDDWTKDLIYTILAVVAVVAVAVVAFVLLPFVGVALLVGAIIGAIVAGAFYFWKYGGTDAFGWGVLAWVFGGAALGALGGWLYSIGAVGAMAGILRTGLARGLTGILNGMRTFGGWLGQGMRYVGRGMRTFGGWLGQGMRTFGGWLGHGFRASIRYLRSFTGWIGQGARRFGSFIGRNAMRFGRWAGVKGRLAITAIGRFYGGWGVFLKAVGIGALVSLGLDLIDYFAFNEPLNIGDTLRNMAINGLVAGIGGPIAGKLKIAFTSKSWMKLTGWGGLSTALGAGAYGLGEFLDGSFTPEDLIVGGIGGLIALPGSTAIANALNDFAEPITQPMGNLINSVTADVYYWNDTKSHPDNNLKNIYNKGLEKFTEFHQSIINLYKRP
ncbi:hypothetical protein [Fictibacillus sp. JL2B1089]|uniref:hypothetical protein n=1 Tax=Fictibacillus sp. JL2B1089 TaxID=3399565 RepID=UPI003A8501ED